MHTVAGISKSTFYRRRRAAVADAVRAIEESVKRRRRGRECDGGVDVCERTASLGKGGDDALVGNDLEIIDIPYDNEFIESQFGSAVPCPEDADEGRVLKDVLQSGLREWAIKENITHAAINSLLEIHRASGIKLPKDARTLLSTDPLNAPVAAMGEGNYLHFGLRNRLVADCSDISVTDSVFHILLTLNIDGQKPYENCKDQLWPILCQAEMGKIVLQPFMIGAYYGRSKPDIFSFCEKWVPELTDVLTSGLKLPGGHFKVSLKGIVCDAPALAFVKGTKLHSGFYGCQRCFVKGVTVDGRRVFFDSHAKLRTDRNFRAKSQREHHTNDTPLANVPGLDLVKHFPLDVMHMLYLGVTKRLCGCLKDGVWNYENKFVNGSFKLAPVGNRRRKLLVVGSELFINKTFELINKCRPSEFARKMSPFSDYSSWKATECRQFLLYISVVVLKTTFSSSNLFKHFCLLFCAARILTSRRSLADYELVENLLRRFVEESVQHYSENFCVYNVHSLIHLTEDFKNYGQLESISAFPFENYQGAIRRLLRGKYLPLSQLWKRIGEKEKGSRQQLKSDLEENTRPLIRATLKNRQSGGISGEHFSSIRHSSGVTFTLGQRGNVMRLFDGTVVCAENFILEGRTLWVIGRGYGKSDNFFEYPMPSSRVGVTSVQGLSEFCCTWRVTEVKCKVYLMPYKQRHVAIDMLH